MTDPPDPGALLHKQEKRQVPFAVPILVSQRVDDLCAILNGPTGTQGQIYRQDLVAALITRAPETLEELECIISDYRAALVRDALVGEAKSAEVIELRPAKPGRRSGR